MIETFSALLKSWNVSYEKEWLFLYVLLHNELNSSGCLHKHKGLSVRPSKRKGEM
jgi:hypothetical protein